MTFDDPKEEQTALTILREGATGEFWKLIVRALQESKDFIQSEMDGEDISELNPEQYKFRNELYKAKKQYLEILMKTPENLASWIGKPESDKKDFDPYDR